jgi:hypothetical protein
VLALQAERTQKEIDLLKIQEDLATLSEDSVTMDLPSSSFSSSSTSLSSIGSIPTFNNSDILSDKLIAANITKIGADGKTKFYATNYQKAQNRAGVDGSIESKV